MLTDTLGHVLTSRVLPANAADGPATIAFWDEVAAAHDLLGQVGFVDSSFHGVFRQHLAQRHGELRRLMPKITEKMLIQELRELESDGIVARASGGPDGLSTGCRLFLRCFIGLARHFSPSYSETFLPSARRGLAAGQHSPRPGHAVQ